MAPNINAADIIEGANYSEDGNGPSLDRVFIVNDMDIGVASERQFLVSNLVTIPQINDSHPTVPNINCLNKTVDPIDSEQYRVTCSYRRPNADEGDARDGEEGQISIGGNITTERTTQDFAGAEMVLTPTDDRRPQPVVVDVNKAQFFARFTRRESSAPDSAAETNVNKTNSVAYLGRAIGEVYCSSITGDSDDGGNTYTVVYEFLVNPGGYDIRAVYVDPTNSQYVDNPSVPNGTEDTFQLYEQVDFNLLGLTP